MKVVWMLAALLVSGGAAAQPLLNPSAIPGLTAPGQAAYARFLLTNTPRVFATDGQGHMGWYAGAPSLDQARSKAIALCKEHGGAACQPYAEDLNIVWPGAQWTAPKPPAPFVDSWNWGLFPDARFLWHGPANAAGVVVWAHGKSGDIDYRGVQPPPFLRAFNNAGFDIVRFDREPVADTTLRAQGWMRDGVSQMRRAGYRIVAVAGQSRGAWNALQMLDVPGLADVVIATSPAAQGSGASTNLASQDDELRRIVDNADPGRTRLAVVQFSNDPFAADLGARARLIDQLRAKLGALLLIDQPEGFSGHLAAGTQAFSARFAACLLQFATAPRPPSTCPAPE